MSDEENAKQLREDLEKEEAIAKQWIKDNPHMAFTLALNAHIESREVCPCFISRLVDDPTMRESVRETVSIYEKEKKNAADKNKKASIN